MSEHKLPNGAIAIVDTDNRIVQYSLNGFLWIRKDRKLQRGGLRNASNICGNRNRNHHFGP